MIISATLKLLIKIVSISNIVIYELEHVKQYAPLSCVDYVDVVVDLHVPVVYHDLHPNPNPANLPSPLWVILDMGIPPPQFTKRVAYSSRPQT